MLPKVCFETMGGHVNSVDCNPSESYKMPRADNLKLPALDGFRKSMIFCHASCMISCCHFSRFSRFFSSLFRPLPLQPSWLFARQIVLQSSSAPSFSALRSSSAQPFFALWRQLRHLWNRFSHWPRVHRVT